MMYRFYRVKSSLKASYRFIQKAVIKLYVSILVVNSIEKQLASHTNYRYLHNKIIDYMSSNRSNQDAL